MDRSKAAEFKDIQSHLASVQQKRQEAAAETERKAATTCGQGASKHAETAATGGYAGTSSR